MSSQGRRHRMATRLTRARSNKDERRKEWMHDDERVGQIGAELDVCTR